MGIIFNNLSFVPTLRTTLRVVVSYQLICRNPFLWLLASVFLAKNKKWSDDKNQNKIHIFHLGKGEKKMINFHSYHKSYMDNKDFLIIPKVD